MRKINLTREELIKNIQVEYVRNQILTNMSWYDKLLYQYTINEQDCDEDLVKVFNIKDIECEIYEMKYRLNRMLMVAFGEMNKCLAENRPIDVTYKAIEEMLNNITTERIEKEATQKVYVISQDTTKDKN